jgi:hypothetical protein
MNKGSCVARNFVIYIFILMLMGGGWVQIGVCAEQEARNPEL